MDGFVSTGSVVTLDELKARMDPVSIYGEYLRLKTKGNRLWGLCPFHSEKTPSFSVDAEQGLYYCFGCHQGGDAMGFVMAMEGCTFLEAAQRVAEKIGLTIQTQRGRGGDAAGEERVAKRKRTLHLIKQASEFYVGSLQATQEAHPARQFLVDREIPWGVACELGLGYAPDQWHAVQEHLTKTEGATSKELDEAGLLQVKTDKVYDRFRNRLLFPIHDGLGRVVGFGGRVLKAGEEPKYLNSPENPVFKKRKILYGFHESRDAIRSSGTVVLVEGYMDWLALRQVGVKNCVATMGTALTTDHTKVLGRFVDEVSLLFDGDTAGAEATKKAVITCLENNLMARVISLEPGKDPDDIRREKGAEVLCDQVARSEPFFSYLATQSIKKHPGWDVSARRARVQAVLPFLRAIKSSVLRETCLSETAALVRLDMAVLREALVTPRGFDLSEEKSAPIPPLGTAEELILAILGAKPEWAPNLKERLTPEVLEGLPSAAVVQTLIREGISALPPDAKVLMAKAGAKEQGVSWEREDLEQAVCLLERRHGRRRLHRLSLEIRRVETTGDQQFLEVLLKEMESLSERFPAEESING